MATPDIPDNLRDGPKNTNILPNAFGDFLSLLLCTNPALCLVKGGIEFIVKSEGREALKKYLDKLGIVSTIVKFEKPLLTGAAYFKLERPQEISSIPQDDPLKAIENELKGPYYIDGTFSIDSSFEKNFILSFENYKSIRGQLLSLLNDMRELMEVNNTEPGTVKKWIELGTKMDGIYFSEAGAFNESLLIVKYDLKGELDTNIVKIFLTIKDPKLLRELVTSNGNQDAISLLVVNPNFPNEAIISILKSYSENGSIDWDNIPAIVISNISQRNEPPKELLEEAFSFPMNDLKYNGKYLLWSLASANGNPEIFDKILKKFEDGTLKNFDTEIDTKVVQDLAVCLLANPLVRTEQFIDRVRMLLMKKNPALAESLKIHK